MKTKVNCSFLGLALMGVSRVVERKYLLKGHNSGLEILPSSLLLLKKKKEKKINYNREPETKKLNVILERILDL